VFGCTPSCCICWNSCNALSPSPQFAYPNIMAVHKNASCKSIFQNTLHQSSMLPHLAYISIKLFSTKTSDLQPLQWLNCSWKHLPSSNEGTWSTWKASLLTFSNLQSHHCEGSENKSCQSCTLWPPGTMQTAEISDKTCHQTADLIHAHANARTPVFCDPDWHHLFHHLV
jgi:hypothetical protein